MFENYLPILRERLDDYRYDHCIQVAKQAAYLAKKYGFNSDKAYLAGLLHDITKNDSGEQQLQLIENSDIMLTIVERMSPKLWHSISGAAFIKNVLNITDEDIISSVRYHTTGKADMSLIEKIIYIADYTSADRKYPDVDVVRELVEKSLDNAIIYTLRYTIKDLTDKKVPIHPDTVAAYNQLICDNQGE